MSAATYRFDAALFAAVATFRAIRDIRYYLLYDTAGIHLLEAQPS